MPTVTMEEVQCRLPELLDALAPGEDVVITRDGRAVARLTPPLPVGVPVPGRGRGKLVILSEEDESFPDPAGP